MKRYLWKILAMVLIISCGFIFISQKTFAEEIGGQVTEENQLGGGYQK